MLRRLWVVFILVCCFARAANAQTPFLPSDLSGQATPYQSGIIALQEQRFESAILYFRQAIDADPRSADAWLGLSSALRRNGDVLEADEVLEQFWLRFPVTRSLPADSQPLLTRHRVNLESKPHRTTTVSLGLGKTSNATLGPNISSVLLVLDNNIVEAELGRRYRAQPDRLQSLEVKHVMASTNADGRLVEHGVYFRGDRYEQWRDRERVALTYTHRISGVNPLTDPSEMDVAAMVYSYAIDTGPSAALIAKFSPYNWSNGRTLCKFGPTYEADIVSTGARQRGNGLALWLGAASRCYLSPFFSLSAEARLGRDLALNSARAGGSADLRELSADLQVRLADSVAMGAFLRQVWRADANGQGPLIAENRPLDVKSRSVGLEVARDLGREKKVSVYLQKKETSSNTPLFGYQGHDFGVVFRWHYDH